MGSLAEIFDVSMQTIRQDTDIICDSETFRRRHGHIELAEQYLNTPFDQRAGTNISERDINRRGCAHQERFHHLHFDRLDTFVAALRDHKELTVITNNLSAAMALVKSSRTGSSCRAERSGYPTAIFLATGCSSSLASTARTLAFSVSPGSPGGGSIPRRRGAGAGAHS